MTVTMDDYISACHPAHLINLVSPGPLGISSCERQ